MDQILVSAAKQLEKQLDSEIERLDTLTVDDIDAIRDKRLKEMKQRQEKIIVWKSNVRISSHQIPLVSYCKIAHFRDMENIQNLLTRRNFSRYPRNRRTL